MTITTITLDLVFENDITELNKVFEGTNITMSIIQENGPGGGWPVCELTGEEEDLRQWLADNYACDDSDVEFFMGNED